MTRRLALSFAAVVVTGSVTLVGCGTPQAQSTSSATAQQPLSVMPTANDFISAISHTRDLGTADLDITVQSDIGGRSSTDRGIGTVALDPGSGDIRWTGTSGNKRDLGNDVALFVQSQPPAGIWTRYPRGTVTTTSGFANPLGRLGSLVGVVDAGPEPVSGTPARHYTGTLPADANELESLGLSKNQIASLEAPSTRPPIEVSVWIDEAGRVVRVDKSFTAVDQDGSPVRVHASTLLTDFMGDIDLTDPPSQSVSTAPTST